MDSRAASVLGCLSTSRAEDLRIGALAGLAGATAYLIEMEIDLKAFRYHADDLLLLGGTFLREDRDARRLGLVIHLATGVVVGCVYRRYVCHRLWGPGWLRGVMFASVENAGLYALAKLENHHPAIKRGRLVPYWNRTAFVQGVLRHIAFGAVLGHVADRINSRQADTTMA